MNDFIKVYRQIREHWIYQRSDYFHIWFEMLACAKYTFEPEKKIIDGMLITVEYGDFIFGRPSWSKRLNVTEQILRTFVHQLISSGMIVLKKKHSKFTIYNIVNFKKFNQQGNQQEHLENKELQDNSNQHSNQHSTSTQPALNQHSTTNKKLKESKEGKNIIYISSKEDIVSGADKVPYQEIINLFNTTCITLPNIRDITGNRQRTVRVLWKENHSIDYFKELFNKVNDSDFLSGKSGKWMNCNFDWVVKPENRKKIMEDTYLNKDKTVSW